jgi:hypothetical protein
MDPYIVLSSRILHEERIASAMRRNRLLQNSQAVTDQREGWRGLVARLLSFARPRARSLEKRTIA